MLFRSYDLSPAGDPHWEAILPPNGGFILAEREEANGSTVTISTGISMFHQLHCLQIIRKAIQGYMGANDCMSVEHEQGEDEMTHEHGATHHDHHDQTHWVHCLDYLAQVSDYACLSLTTAPLTQSLRF